MPGDVDLRTKLSRLLVAWTIEFDNAFEQAMLSTWARPFLVSATMWGNVMQHVPGAGVEVAELVTRSSIGQKSLASLLGGLERWGYVTIDHDPASGHPGRRDGFGTARGIKAATMVYPSAVGALAQGIWPPLAAEIDERWRRRSGADVDRLTGAVSAMADAVGGRLPAFLPVVNSQGLFSEPVLAEAEEAVAPRSGSLGLSTALSRVLLALTVDVERDAQLSLPAAANVLRVLNAEPTPVRDLPIRAGVSKEAVSLVLGLLEKQAAASVEPLREGRGKAAIITARGEEIRAQLATRVGEVESEWNGRFGASFDALSDAASALHNDDFLRPALAAPATGWRADKRYAALTAAFVDGPTRALPHQPMVLHRGGWPDGS